MQVSIKIINKIEMNKTLYAAILFSIAANANAANDYFGKWRVFGANDGNPPMALTSNDSDNAFGQVCAEDAEGCFWMILSPNIPCKRGESSPMLGNSSSGSSQFTAHCAGAYEISGTKYHRYVISPFDDATAVVTESSGILSFAMPVQSGSFTVMRFDLTGSTKAISRLDELKIKFFKQIKSGSTKDIRL